MKSLRSRLERFRTLGAWTWLLVGTTWLLVGATWLLVGATGRPWEAAAQTSRPATQTLRPATQTSRPAGETTTRTSRATSRPEASAGAKAARLASHLWVLESGAMKDKYLAAEGLGEMGVEALPALGALEKALSSKDKTLREKAAGALMQMGSHAKAAYPSVARLLNDEGSRVRMFAGEILRRAGKEGLPALKAVFLDKTITETLRMSLLEAFGRLGAQAEEMIPRVALALEEPDRLIRQQAAKTLGDIGGPRASAILQNRLGSKGLERDPYVRIFLLHALARLHDPKALPLFKKALTDPSALVRQEARRLLQQARR